MIYNFLKDNVPVMVCPSLIHSIRKTRLSKMGTFAFLLVGLFLFPSKPSLGEETITPTALSLNQALALAVKSHPMISSKRMEYQAAIGDLNAARWSAFPNASFSFRGFRRDENENRLDQEKLTVSQPLWTGGRLSGNIKVAKAGRDVAKWGVVESEQVLIEETIRAFIELNRANSKVKISAENVKEHERLFDIIKRRVDASTSPEVDLRLAAARLAFSRSQLLQNSNAVAVSKTKLEQFIGQPVFQIIAPSKTEKWPVSLQDSEKAALAFSPLIRKMRSEISGLEGLEKVAKSLLYPQVTLGYERRFGEFSSNEEEEQVFLGMDFQPGAGLSARSSISVSKARKGALQDSLLALERDIRQKVQITWRDFSSAEMQLSPTKLLVESTSSIVASYLRQYVVGRKSWLDVLNAQRELVMARQSLVDHEATLIMSSYMMQILVGEINTKTVSVRND